ncbi:hypothetical protein [Streptomyces antimycoticus]|uniref:hypothetical protein n=1 Tax=Streptomyces antimycoticus TaxID=68175 RepID=UPI00257077FB|nr:hypothetical protein [Streptomyces antimycoticus]WJD99765.1 hypothetical protein QR300_29370 [Streptomyces antimycoticus]
MHAPLPVHPLTGASALGWRKARPGEDEDELYPIWPILGGAADEGEDEGGDGGQDEGADDAEGDSDDGQDDAEGDEDEGEPDGADQLGDKGKRALAAMKGKWKSERDKRQALERQLATKGKDDDGEDATDKAVQAATAAANGRILRAEIKAAAKGRLADPKDALTFLDLSKFEVDEDGSVDEDEIAEAIGDLLTKKPYLAAQGGKRFQGTGDGGAARKAGRPKQLTRADLQNMTPAQIVEAKAKGQLDDALKAAG